MKIIWSPRALKRVREIASYISYDKPGAAQNWIDSIFNAVKRLGRFPKSGRLVPEIDRPNIREMILGSYRIVYRIEKKRISILTVRHGRQILLEREYNR